MDRHESVRLQQECAAEGFSIVIHSLQGAENAQISAAILSAFSTGQIQISPKLTGLIQDCRSVEIVEKNGVMKLMADRDARGHCDEFFAMACGICAAQQLTSMYCGPIAAPTFHQHREINPMEHGVRLASSASDGRRYHLAESVRFAGNRFARPRGGDGYTQLE